MSVLTRQDLVEETSLDVGLAQDLLTREAALLDSGQLDEWLAAGTSDMRYRVPKPTAIADDRIDIINDERADLEERVWRIQESGLNHSQDPPTRQMRCVTNVQVESMDDPKEFHVRCYTVLWEIRSGSHDAGRPVACHPMRCEYTWRLTDDGWRIAQKVLVLLEAAAPLGTLTNIL
jgi:3-phenylpropionate/cinnamic acid dioxygenase small subunit